MLAALIILVFAFVWVASAALLVRLILAENGLVDADEFDGAVICGPISFVILAWFAFVEHCWPFIRRHWRYARGYWN
jgi:hypothetical protein